jgi:WD40 repeat protein
LLLTYKINNSPGSYGEKKLVEISKKEDEQYVTKFKKIKDFLFLGYNNGNIEMIDFNNEKKEPSIYTKIENAKSAMSLNDNYKISNIFYRVEKGLLYIFVEKDKKISIYEINHKNHMKDIQLCESPIIYSYISFDMNKIFVIDSYGTFWIYELFPESNTVKLLQACYTKLYNITTAQIFSEKNNDQTLNIFIGTTDKFYLYQYSNKNNNFILKLTFDVQFPIKTIIYSNQYKCLIIGCDNGTIQIWKDSSKTPIYIIETGYPNINKLFYDEKNKYIFVNSNKSLKILEINLEKILINENEEKEKDEEKEKVNVIAENIKDEEDKVAENNIRLLSQAFQTPLSSVKDNLKEDKKELMENKNIKSNNIDLNKKDSEDEKDYNYEVKSIGSLDGWDEW